MSKSSDAAKRKLEGRNDTKGFTFQINLLFVAWLFFSVVLPAIRFFYPSFGTAVESEMYFGWGTIYLILGFTLTALLKRITALERLVAELQMKGAAKHPG